MQYSSCCLKAQNPSDTPSSTLLTYHLRYINCIQHAGQIEKLEEETYLSTDHVDDPCAMKICESIQHTNRDLSEVRYDKHITP
jgi:hypothetical protein